MAEGSHGGQIPFVGDGVPRRTANQLIAVRAIVAATTRPEIGLDVESLANATALDPGVVQRILQSEEFRDLVRQEGQARVATILNRGLTRMEQLVSEGAPSIAINAFRVVVGAYRALTDDRIAQHASDQSAANLEQMFAKLDAMQKIRLASNTRIGVTVEEAAKQPQEAPQEQP